MGVKLVSNLGGSVELNAPATAANYTLTTPAINGTVLLDTSPVNTQRGTPLLIASGNAGVSVASSTFTLIPYQVEEADTASCYNNTNATVGGIPPYAFRPNLAGYYQVNANINSSVSATGSIFITLFKNGSSYQYGVWVPNSSQAPIPTLSSIVYLNGSTDYIQIYGNQSSGTTLNLGATSTLYKFTAAFLRGI